MSTEDIINDLRKNFVNQRKLMDKLKAVTIKNEFTPSKKWHLEEKECIVFYKEDVPKKLRVFLGLEKDVELSRADIVTKFYEYLKENDLIDKKTKKITLNSKIKKLFDMNKDDVIDFYNLFMWINKVYDSN
jgi:hypothetical protein